MKKIICLIISLSVILTVSSSTAITAFAAEQKDPIRYGFTTITDPDVRYVYSLLESELTSSDPPTKIEFSDKSVKISTDELNLALQLFLSDYPECFWVRSGYSYSYIGDDVISISPDYVFRGEELYRARAELERSISDIMSGLPSTGNYEKALYLHDRLSEKVTYELIGHHQTAYGALVAGKAVCAGYAAAYQLLLQRAGISAWTVSGYSNNPESGASVAHAWNLVWIDEDTCVYTDVTWDDSDTATFHCYFNLSKEEIEKDHTISDEIFTLPDCNHDNKGYFDVNELNVDDSTSIEKLASLFAPASNGERKATIRYTGHDTNAFKAKLIDRQMELYTALSCGVGTCSISISTLSDEMHITVTANFIESDKTVETSENESTEAEETAFVTETESESLENSESITSALTESESLENSESITSALTESESLENSESITSVSTESENLENSESITSALTESENLESSGDPEIESNEIASAPESYDSEIKSESEKLESSNLSEDKDSTSSTDTSPIGCKTTVGSSFSVLLISLAACTALIKRRRE